MELYLEFFFTILLSVLLSFSISKLLSWDFSNDNRVIEKTSKCKQIIEEESKSCVYGIVVQEFNRVVNESVHEQVRFLEICDGEIDVGVGEEVSNEVLIGGVKETSMEESSREEEEKGEESNAGESREESVNNCVEVYETKLFEENPKRMKLRKIETELSKSTEQVGDFECEKINDMNGNGIVGLIKNEEDDKERLIDDDDDWEDIERTELEKQFGAAVAFVGCKSNASCILEFGTDLQMRLYALHKVAIEGPCLEPQPMAFKVSARAKWNAWHQLGNLCPEAAMEKYINLLSQSFPGWLGDDLGAIKVLGKKYIARDQTGAGEDSEVEELKPCVEGQDFIGIGAETPLIRTRNEMHFHADCSSRLQ